MWACSPDCGPKRLAQEGLKNMPSQEEERERRVLRQVTWRLVPFIFLCYVISYIDRVNIGFAATHLQKDLGFTNTVYGFGAGIFFFGYCLFEVPSNLALDKVGARRWIARIMVMWGLVSMAMAFMVGEKSWIGMRFLLGVAEAGFFPGIILYLTYWFPARVRAKTGALFMMAIPISMLVGAPVSEALLALDGVGGLQGWQWMFLVEGLPAVLAGVAAWFVLTDRPEKATWLAPADRDWLSNEMARERAERSRHHVGFAALKDPKVLILCAICFLNAAATYGVFLFLPKILKEASGFTGLKASLINQFPFAVALVGMVLVGRHSDKTGERKFHVAACAGLAALGIVLATVFRNNVLLLVLSFALSQFGQRALLSVFWSIPSIFLGGTAAAAGIALINSIGNLGGFFGPHIMGYLRDHSTGYTAGLLVLAGALLLEAILVMSLKLPAPSKAAPQAAASPAVNAATAT
jgi:MFS transporter, ACS family, tartrate transporter